MNPTVRLVTGVHPVLEALRAKSRPFHRILLQSGRHGREIDALLQLAEEASVSVRRAPREELDRTAGNGRHQGVVALVGAKGYTPLEEMLDEACGGEQPLFVLVLDGVEDPHNLGAILRTAEAAGVKGVVIPERRAAGLSEGVAKSSAGALEYLPVSRVVNLHHALEQMKARGGWVIGVSEKAKKTYHQADLTGPIALVLGGEGGGLRRRTWEACDDWISIPMLGKVGSLNVSVAAGIIVYEVVRQRKGDSKR